MSVLSDIVHEYNQEIQSNNINLSNAQHTVNTCMAHYGPIRTFRSASRLRSANSQRYEQPATRLKLGERSFAFAGALKMTSMNYELGGTFARTQTDCARKVTNLTIRDKLEVHKRKKNE